jgi:hypothetical protein
MSTFVTTSFFYKITVYVYPILLIIHFQAIFYSGLYMHFLQQLAIFAENISPPTKIFFLKLKVILILYINE